MLAVADRYTGHRNQLLATYLVTRLARGIALSPMRLLAPESRPWLPFLHPTVLGQALAIEPSEKTEGRLYRQLVAFGAPEVAHLPSTNDVNRVKEKGPLRRVDPVSSKWMADSILASEPTMALISRKLLENMHSDRRSWSTSWASGRAGQTLSLFAQWEAAHRDRLVATEPPW